MQPVDWCIKKVAAALADYDLAAANDYIELMKMWRGRE